MAAQYATPDDVQARYEKDLGDHERIWHLLEDVERDLLAEVPDLALRLFQNKTTLSNIKLVVSRAAIRVLRNPAGYASEATPDYSYSYLARSGGTPRKLAGVIEFPPEDLRLLGIRGSKKVGPIQVQIPSWRIP